MVSRNVANVPIASSVRYLTREQFVQQQSQRIYVSTNAYPLIPHTLLRGSVLEICQPCAGPRLDSRCQLLGTESRNSEVRYCCLPGLMPIEHVFRLQIPMHDAFHVRGFNSVQNLTE